jgi:hypothetical protein
MSQFVSAPRMTGQPDAFQYKNLADMGKFQSNYPGASEAQLRQLTEARRLVGQGPATTGAQTLSQPPSIGAVERLTGSPGLGKLFPSWLGGSTEAQLLAARGDQYAQLAGRIDAMPGLTDAQKEIFFKAESAKIAGASNLGQYIGPGVGIGALAYLGGAFEAEQDPFKSTFSDPINPERVRQARLFNEDATFDEIRFAERPPTTFQQIDPGFARFQPNLIRSSSTAFGAHGGEMQNFPPRIGAIAGPGTEKSDDVPAMLSDGEFVMTAQAVRGAGNGSRRQGVKNLYDIMRNFEAVA